MECFPHPSVKEYMLGPGELTGQVMDQAVLFLLFALAMLAGWFGHRSLALALFGLSFVLSVADYFHHATDALPLSF